jgi:omega-3 fatty acid desaturase (delta-15 desaturase)
MRIRLQLELKRLQLDIKMATTEVPRLDDIPSLNDIRKVIPDSCFKKCWKTSVLYMSFDLLMVFLGLVTFPMVYGNGVLMILNNLFTGFFMWSTFVIGHDCGHGSFSDYPILNDICGNICHGVLFVPYWPWQYSHRQHHNYHNHVAKDMSHPWVVEDPTTGEPTVYRMKDECLVKTRKNDIVSVEDYLPVSYMFPFLGFHGYLSSPTIDFIHFWPFCKYPSVEKAGLSSLCCVVFAFAIYRFILNDVYLFLFGYVISVAVFNAWLVIVTFNQHHDVDTKVYGEESWKFVESAFETWDRKYGEPIDTLTHNITDCHIIHHLFFTKIPHYNLKKATQALQNSQYGKLMKSKTEYPLIGFVMTYYTNIRKSLMNYIGDQKWMKKE